MRQEEKSKTLYFALCVDLSVSAGFPSPAGDYLELPLDLNELLAPHRASTFFVRVSGQSMEGAGINDSDLLVVDRSLQAQHGNVVIAVIDSEFTVKRLSLSSGKVFLLPANGSFKPIEVEENTGAEIWGVVRYVIHKTK